MEFIKRRLKALMRPGVDFVYRHPPLRELTRRVARLLPQSIRQRAVEFLRKDGNQLPESIRQRAIEFLGGDDGHQPELRQPWQVPENAEWIFRALIHRAREH